MLIELPQKIYRSAVPESWRKYVQFYRTIHSYKKWRQPDQEPNLLQDFDKYRCIFIHIPKAAGISIRESLFGNKKWRKHIDAQTFQLIFGKKNFNRYFKFAFVRNPWARTLSAYNFLKKGGISTPDKTYSEQIISNYPTFEAFVKQWLTKENASSWIHFIPQYRWIVDKNDKIIIDYIGKVETIQEDYEYIRKKIGIGENLKHVNKGNPKDYRQAYTEEMKHIVEEVYREDIDRFHYSF
jgi:hypothetical protein